MSQTLEAATDKLQQLRQTLRREDPTAEVRGSGADTVEVASTLSPARVQAIITTVFAPAVDGCCSDEESADGCCGCCGN